MAHERDLEITVNGTGMTVHYLEGESKEERSKRLKQKLIPNDEVAALGEFLRKRQKRIVVTSGAFDVIHEGHTRYINLAKSLGDVLVIGLNSDSSIKGYKGPLRPIRREMPRAEMLASLDDVDYITLYDEPTAGEVIKKLKPDAYLCVEGSWEGDIATKAEIVAMAEVGGQVFCAARQGPAVSTSSIIETIADVYGKEAFEKYKQMMDSSGNGK